MKETFVVGGCRPVGLEFGMKRVKCRRGAEGGGSGLSKTCFRDCAVEEDVFAHLSNDSRKSCLTIALFVVAPSS